MATQNGVVVPSKQPSIIAIASAALAAGTMGAMIYKQREKSNMSTKLNKTASICPPFPCPPTAVVSLLPQCVLGPLSDG